ncbi:MAG: putative Ig domain-containing protein [Verrucomicrobiota bacterium]
MLPGSADLASWTILDEPIDVVGSTNPGWVAHDGNISLDLAGTPGAGVIQQTFSTQPGKAYSVSFWFSGNPDSLGLFPDESTLMQMRVSVGAEDRLFTFDTAVEKNTLSDMKWKQYSFTFVATESLSTLQFRNENGRVYAGPALDSVSVYELATPNRITSITVNRTPAGSLDASGNFFAGFNLNSGANPIEVVATDSYGQQTTAKIAVFGSPCPEGFLAFSPANALPVYGEASFNEATKVLYTELALQNTSANLLHGPFFLGISDISDPSIVPLSSDATSSDGEPLYNFTGALSAGVLNPEALTAYRALAFLNPNRVPFTYKPTLLVPVNQAPFFVSVPLIEAAATALYAYAARASDPDGDALSYRLVKGPPGMTIDANSGLVQWNPTAQDIGAHSVSLSVSDGRGGSGAQSFTLAVLSSSGNQAPIISSSPGLSVPVRQNYSYDVAASDPDGDSITFSLVTAPAGMTVDLATGIIRWATSLSDVGPHPVQLRVTDSHSAFTDQSFTIQVTAPAQDTQAPVVYLSIVVGTSALLGPEVTVNRGTTVEFRVDATDNVGVIERALTVAGVPVSLDSSGRAMLTMNSVSISAVFAAAKDAAGNTGTASRSIRVIDPLDAHEPLITIHSPANSTLVSALTDIIASISDPVLESYHVDFAQFDQIDPAKLDADDSAWINISHGAGQVEHAAVGKFDPTILLNDSYVIRVVAQNINGRIRAEGVIVDLVNNLKFGEFRLQFTDLTIPLAGIPIQVGRVYDSRTSRDKGDFGFGWTLGVRDARITEIRKVPYAGLDGDSTFTTSTRIYLNTPDGRRVGFNFTPQLCSIGFFGPVYAPAFTADPGVYETLEADSALCAYKVDSDGRFIDSFGLVGFDPSVYRLTMKDGTVYKYDQTGGLQNITDLNGNKIAFSATGISHFQSGQSSPDTSIRFVRDGEGRITSIIDPTGHELRYAYDAGGDLRSFADQVNNLTHYTYSSARSHYLETLIDPLGHQAIKTEYDEAGRIKSITDAAGNKVSQDFDLAQNIGTYTNGRGTVTFSQFDDRGNEVLKWLPGIYTNRFEFDANNNLTRGVNGRGHNTNYVYDAKGNITTIKDAFGHLTSITYNDQNKPTQILNALNQSITLNYDSQGNLLKVVNNAGFETTMTRDSMGRLTSVKDAAGNTTQFNYDGGCSCGKPGKVINADGSFRLYSYNEFGQTTSAINELGAETKSEYDDSGRLLSVTDPLGNKTSYQYSGLLVTAMTDALGRTTHYEYDSQNRTNKVVDPAGGVVQFKYDANGNRTKVVDPVGNVTSFVYDAANRLTQEINTFGDKRLYAYDETGNRVQTIDRNGRKRTFDYDELNRMVAEKWWDGPSVIRTILFAFNALGVQTLASDPAARYDYTYDSLNRLTQVAQSAVPGQPDFTLNYTYTPLGQVESATDNYGVRVGSLYDNRNRLSTRTWQGGGIDPARVDFAYDPVGNRTRTDRFSDLAGAHRVGHSTFAYNQASTLSNITHRGPADEILAQYDYTFDAAYQITHWLIDGGNSDFSYDANGQLTGAVNTAQPNEIFKYDANGYRVGAQSA